MFKSKLESSKTSLENNVHKTIKKESVIGKTHMSHANEQNKSRK